MNWKSICLAVTFLVSAASVARADDPVSLGSFGDWESFTYQANGAPVCYIYSVPQKSEATKRVKRDPIYFLVTNFSGRKIKGQVSTIIGYPFKESSTVTVMVDENAFELYSNGDTAWAADAATEANIVKGLKSASTLMVVGTSSKGTETTDTYSLAGFGKAMDKIDSACK